MRELKTSIAHLRRVFRFTSRSRSRHRTCCPRLRRSSIRPRELWRGGFREERLVNPDVVLHLRDVDRVVLDRRRRLQLEGQLDAIDLAVVEKLDRLLQFSTEL